MPSLFDMYPEMPGYQNTDTSYEAALSAAEKAANLRGKCLRAIGHRDMTADECAAVLGEDILSIRPRITELGKMKLLVDTGKRKKNERSGKKAIVWSVRK